MKNPELYKKTVDILYDAYFNDTLEHVNCAACAIGNIILASNGVKPVRESSGELRWPHEQLPYCERAAWYDVIKQRKSADAYMTSLLKTTGYSIYELSKIEDSFEKCDKGNTKADWMFNGLVAVLEVLKEIHEVSDEPHVENINRFKNHYQTL